MGQDSKGFASPFAVETPPGAEGWERLYPYYYLFSDDRREFEEGKFWFFDGMHNPEPIYPFDSIMNENWWVALNQYTTRVWVVPPALGIGPLEAQQAIDERVPQRRFDPQRQARLPARRTKRRQVPSGAPSASAQSLISSTAEPNLMIVNFSQQVKD